MKCAPMVHNSIQDAVAYERDEDFLRHGDSEINIDFGNVCGNDSIEITREFEAVISLRPRTQNPIWSCPVNLVPGESLDSAEWQKLLTKILKEIGLDPCNHLWLAIKHINRPHQHCHLEVSRIGFDGSIWSNDRDLVKVAEITTQLEKEFNLIQTRPMVEILPNGDKIYNKAPKRRPSTREIRDATDRGLLITERESIQDAIDQALAHSNRSSSIEAFTDFLKFSEIRADLKTDRSGKRLGFRFHFKNKSFKGSELGADYSLNGLISRGLLLQTERNPMTQASDFPQNTTPVKPNQIAFKELRSNCLRQIRETIGQIFTTNKTVSIDSFNIYRLKASRQSSIPTNLETHPVLDFI